MKVRAWVVPLVAVLGLQGCAGLDRLFCAPDCKSTQIRSSSSLVGFLYPKGELPPAAEELPQLRVPLRVGLAFLPSQGSAAQGLTAAQKEELLERVRQRFADRKFVSEIVFIPDYYLHTARGFEGLQGVQRLYSVDVMALISYDQVTHTDDNRWSLGYLTIVGSYVLKGSRHDVSTLVDLAVVDPVTRSLLLRAGGVDTRQRSTTLIEQNQTARASSAEGFVAATNHMIENFDGALTKFEANVRAGKANVRVASRGGSISGGGGAFNTPWFIAALLLIAGSRRWLAPRA